MRTKQQVVSAPCLVKGASFPNRDACELYAAEILEAQGKLMAVSRKGFEKTASRLTAGCTKPGCKGCHKFLNKIDHWELTGIVPCSCPPGPAIVTPSTGSTAIPTRALVAMLKPLFEGDQKISKKALVQVLTDVLYRPINPSLLQRVRAVALLEINGDPVNELQILPARIAALNQLGHNAGMVLLNAEQMKDRLVDIQHGVIRKRNYAFKTAC